MVIQKTKVVVKDLMTPFYRFFRIQSSGGIMLIIAALIALVWANSPLSSFYFDFLHFKLSIGAGDFVLEKSLHHWINDGLMALFFFVVGLEIKREIMVGELSEVQKAILPIGAAIGGMIFPALIFLILQGGTPAADGWGVPMATDIAFSIGVLMLMGKRAPLALKVFLVTFAIVDDIGAVAVIAIFYSQDILRDFLLLSGALYALLLVSNLFNIRYIFWYGFIGIIIWFLFLKSGIHPTLAGVLIAFVIPSNRKLKFTDFLNQAQRDVDIFRSSSRKDKLTLSKRQLLAIDKLENNISKVQSPLQSLEHNLSPFVTYIIMPVFAITNAGVVLSGGNVSVFSALSLTIILALISGKIIGIFGFTWLMVKLKIGALSKDMNMKMIFGASLLGGIGFTMSLFISNLAYTDAVLLNNAKLGILIASLIAGTIGFFVLRRVTREFN